jgi:photosystem II stability/assembly factor-like uncharacterized protein
MTVLRVVAAAAACAVLATGASASPRTTHALWLGSRVFVTADGKAWRNVTPRGVAPPIAIDNVAFHGNRGWLVASICGSDGFVFRSIDGGRSWVSYAFHHRHSCNAGSNFLLDVLDGTRAWVVQNEPAGSFASLYRTIDGGRSWRTVNSKSLPDVGSVTFVSAKHGWLSGGRLFRTADGGKNWTRIPLSPPNGYAGKLLRLSNAHFFGRTGIVAGEYFGHRHVIGFYRTSDAGRSWRLVATLAGSAPYIYPQFTVSAVSASTIWLLTAGAKPVANVTIDGGRHWSSHALPRKLYAPVALSARTAAASDFRGSPYITRDGGRTWSRLKL